MNKWINTIEEHKRTIALTPQEKSGIRDAVVSFMKANPVTAIPSPFLKRSPFAIRSLVAIRRFHFAPVSLIVLLLLGSGLSATAEETVPGDALYFFKTTINENVMGWLALSDEAKVNLEAQIAGNRLEEAEKLASQNKLSEPVKTKLVAKFQARANNVKEGVKTLESQGKIDTAAGVSSKFESSLNAHEDVLRSLNDVQVGTEDLAKSVAEDVKVEATGIAVVRAVLEDKVKAEAITSATTTEASAVEASKIAGENVTVLTDKLAQASQENISAEALAGAYAHVSLATTTMAEADSEMAKKNFGDAFALYQKAHRLVGEVEVTFDAEQELNIKVVSGIDDISTSTPATASTTPKTTATSTPKTTATTATTTATTTLKAGIKTLFRK